MEDLLGTSVRTLATDVTAMGHAPTLGRTELSEEIATIDSVQ